jgi:hypothetical protein
MYTVEIVFIDKSRKIINIKDLYYDEKGNMRVFILNESDKLFINNTMIFSILIEEDKNV